MRIYFSGIGVGTGPLAMIAKDIGHEVFASNNSENEIVEYMQSEGFNIVINQDASYLKKVHSEKPIDWFVYTSALPSDHPELIFAQKQNIKTSKRDQFINDILKQNDLKMIAISGTHGKTNTTGMLTWCLQNQQIPVSYSIGARISFGPFGKFTPGSKYFIYEADEFDRNMLKFNPEISLITTVDFDHPDTYVSSSDYTNAFEEFINKTKTTYIYEEDAAKTSTTNTPNIHIIKKDPNENTTNIPGIYIRQNARLVIELLKNEFNVEQEKAVELINSYPGTARRMEKITHNLYFDYAHHPTEIKSAIQQACEINPSVVVVYQPHQNIRQHEIADKYNDCFKQAKHVYWLPTYLSRENTKDRKLLSPEYLISKLDDPKIATPSRLGDKKLTNQILNQVEENGIVLFLSAGDLYEWVIENFK